MILDVSHILAGQLARVAGDKAADVIARLEDMAARWPETRDAYLAAAHEVREAIVLRDMPLEELLQRTEADLRALSGRAA